MTMTLDLTPEIEAGLLAEAQRNGMTVEGLAEMLLKRHVEETSTPAGTDQRPIWEVITDLTRDVPDEVFDRLPKDGASQVDHYIYGVPKRTL